MTSIKKLSALVIILTLAGCVAHTTKVTSNYPGVKIELDGDYIGETPCEIQWTGTMVGTFPDHAHYCVIAYPIQGGQQVQSKYFYGGKKIPKTIYFDMNLIKTPIQYQIDLN